jgi:branched-chain amino acid aminotransferase
MNRAQAYGDGLFETMRVSNRKVLHPEEHYFRLLAGMRILRMPIPSSWNPDGWLAELKLGELDPTKDYRVRFQVSRTGSLGYAPGADAGVAWSVEATALDGRGYPLPVLRPELGLFQEHRKSEGLLSTVKSSSALLYVLAAGFAREQRVDDVLILNQENNVLEASRSNVMLLQGNTLTTPPLRSGALRGVMRDVVLGLAPRLGLEVREELFSPFALQQVDEVWLTNSINGVAAVRQFRKTTYGSAAAEAMQKLIQERSEVAQFQ